MQYDVLAFLAVVGEEGPSKSISEKMVHLEQDTNPNGAGAVYLGEICEDGETHEILF